MKNETNTGIWIDSKQATIVQLNGGKETIDHVYSDIEGRTRYDGEGKKFGRMGNQYLNDEKTEDERHKHQLNDFYKNVLLKIHDADAIYIMGPAEAKIGLQKSISSSKNLSPRAVIVDAADHLTENQIVAKVKQHFQA